MKKILAVILLILVVLVACKTQTQVEVEADQPAEPPQEQQAEQETTLNAAVEVKNQVISDMQVIIDRVNLDKSGFIVLYADDNGQVGDVIGSSGALTGEATNVRVEITTEYGGDDIHIQLHYDGDEDGFFDEGSDPRVEGSAAAATITRLAQPTQTSEETDELGGEVHTVLVNKGELEPFDISIKNGDTVVWKNTRTGGAAAGKFLIVFNSPYRDIRMSNDQQTDAQWNYTFEGFEPGTKLRYGEAIFQFSGTVTITG